MINAKPALNQAIMLEFQLTPLVQAQPRMVASVRQPVPAW